MFMGRTDLYVAHDERTHKQYNRDIKRIIHPLFAFLLFPSFFSVAKNVKTEDKSKTTKPLNISVYKVKVLRIIKILHQTVAREANKQGN